MAFTPRTLFDALGSFELGMNSGIDPQNLPRNQLANLTNGTVRGQFVRPRGAFRKLSIVNLGNSTLQGAFETALFQCAAYYKPDVGNESVMIAASGRLFQFSIAGNNATLYERTIAGDLNSTTAAQNWLWQAEQFLIWNDGLRLPVFFDGSTSRRSTGAVASLGNITGGPTVPALGASVAATISPAYSGPNNAIVSITNNAGNYLYAIQLGSPTVVLTNLSDNAASRPAGQIFNYQPGLIGFSTAINGAPGANIFDTNTEVDISVSPMLHPPDNGVTFFTENTVINNWPTISPRRVYWIVVSSTATTVRAKLDPSQSFPQPLPWSIFLNNNNQMQLTAIPDVTQFTVGTTFMPPAIGADVTVTFTQAFTLPVGTVLEYQFDEAKAYVVKSVTPPPASSTSVFLVNLNDPAVGVAMDNPAAINSVNELPSGRMGAYWHGRNWMALTDGRRFIASDIVLGASGTVAYSKRDAVLRVTENTFLAGGGFFIVPSSAGKITAIMPTSAIDESLGQGPLSVLTATTIFSCLAPVNRIGAGGWQDITNPILPPSVIGSGGQGQVSTVLANSDFFYRALDGIRSQILARREFSTWGNVPQSREVDATLREDAPDLLAFSSAAVFDNRLLVTSSPVQSSLGVFHTRLVALNFDPLSSLQGKAQAVYDGIWEDLNILQLIGGSFAGVQRQFAVCVSSDLSKMELWEILPTDGPLSDTHDEGDAKKTYDLQSSQFNFHQDDPRIHDCLRLLDGEFYIDEMTEDVTFTAYYRPDEWPEWVQWRTWTEKFDPDSDPQFRPRLGLGEPSSEDADNVNGRPLREGYTFQFRLVVEGNCRFKGARFKAVTIPTPEFAKLNADAV